MLCVGLCIEVVYVCNLMCYVQRAELSFPWTIDLVAVENILALTLNCCRYDGQDLGGTVADESNGNVPFTADEDKQVSLCLAIVNVANNTMPAKYSCEREQ